MNAELLTAIQTAWNASTDLTDAFADGLWVSKAKTKAALPLCVLSEVASPASYQTCQSVYFENVVIQLTAYASESGNTSAADFLLDAADAIEVAFNNKPIPMSTDRVLAMRKLSGGLPSMEDDKIWRIDLQYQIWVQRNV